EQKLQKIENQSRQNLVVIEDIEQREQELHDAKKQVNATQKMLEQRFDHVMEVAKQMDALFVKLKQKDQEVEEQKIVLAEQQSELESHLNSLLKKEKQIFEREKAVADE